MARRDARERLERRSVEIDGRPVHYGVAGQGEPVILVHGLSGSSRWWSRNIDALARQFRVFVVDLPGFGSNRGWRRFTLDTAAAQMVAWMDRVEIDRASIVGHSMGGYIAADLAATYPDRVARLVLVDAMLIPYSRPFQEPVRGGMGLLRRLPIRFLPVLITDALRAGPFTLHQAGHQLLAADLRARLKQIVAPTLVIWGAHDTLIPLAHGQHLAETLADARLVVIEHAGHNPMWDQPGEFNRATIEFLSATIVGQDAVG